MKIIKKLFISLLFIVTILGLNCIKVQAAVKISYTGKQLHEWARSGDDKFFDTDFYGKYCGLGSNEYASRLYNTYFEKWIPENENNHGVWACANQRGEGTEDYGKIVSVIDIYGGKVFVNGKEDKDAVRKVCYERMAGFVENENKKSDVYWYGTVRKC